MSLDYPSLLSFRWTIIRGILIFFFVRMKLDTVNIIFTKVVNGDVGEGTLTSLISPVMTYHCRPGLMVGDTSM